MGYLKFIPYLYIIFALFFIYDAVIKLQNGENAILSFVFAGIAVFMFFFRRYNAKKFEDRTKK